VSLRGTDSAHCKTGGNQQMSDDAFHGVLLLGRRVSHDSNLRNGCFTSIDELLANEVSRKLKSWFARRVNTRKALPAIACRTIPLSRISKLTFKTPAGRKPPLHLSRIIHIDLLYRRDKNELHNKKRALSACFFIGFHRFQFTLQKAPGSSHRSATDKPRPR
jgi:hypothetical protein